MIHIYKLHGLPSAIVSDRDKIFTSHLWRELFRLAGVELRMSSAYHPQLDGQIERVNQCMETFLRYFANATPSKWFDWLHLEEYWYNTTWHSALKQSPFYVLYGHTPRQLGIDSASSCSVSSLDDWLQRKAVMQALVQQHLARAKNWMKMQADKNRTERSFTVGTWVYVNHQWQPGPTRSWHFGSLAHTSLQRRSGRLLTSYSCRHLLRCIPSSTSPSSKV